MGLTEEYAWKLAFDEEGKIIVVPVDSPELPHGYVETWPIEQRPGYDVHNDPEYERAKVAGLVSG